MYIALSDKLLKEYFKYKMGQNFDKNIIQNLFKYLQPFSITREQLESLNLDIAIKSKIISGGDIVSPSSASTKNDLINSTFYKIILTDSNNNYPYTHINIMNDKFSVNYTATYQSNENRDKVKKHIKNLLLTVETIKIVDKYLSPQYNNQWNKIFTLLKTILPNKNLIINIYYDNLLSTRNIQSLLENYNNKWEIHLNEWNDSTHDRYIETGNLQILLTSGFLNLAKISKDFTYIVKEK